MSTRQTSTRQTSTRQTSTRQTYQQKLAGIVVDNATFIKNNKKNTRGNRHVSTHNDDPMRQNLIKEKQLLTKWRRERFANQKTTLMIRDQARAVREYEKNDLHTEPSYEESQNIRLFKHAGCSEECEKDDHWEWILMKDSEY